MSKDKGDGMLESKKERILLDFVVKDDVQGLHCFVTQQGYMRGFNFLVNGVSPLHQVKSVLMLCYLLMHQTDIYQKDKAGYTLEQVLCHDIKMLLKKCALHKKDNLNIKLLGEVKKRREVYKFVCQVQKRMKDKNFNVPYFHEANRILKQSFEQGSFQFMSSFMGKSMLMPAIISYVALKTSDYLQYDKKTEKYLNTACFNENLLEEIRTKLSKISPSPYYLDEKNKPQLFFHGSVHPKGAVFPLSHVGTKSAARQRLDTIEKTIISEGKSFFKRMNASSEETSYRLNPLFLKMKNPLRIPDFGTHSLKSYSSFFLNYCFLRDKGVDFMRELYPDNKFYNFITDDIEIGFFARALSQHTFSKEVDYVLFEPERMSESAVQKELALGGLFDFLTDIEGKEKRILNQKNLILQRMILFFEQEGYDGFVYNNICEDRGHDSFIIFRPEQVVYSSIMDEQAYITPVVPQNKEQLNQLKKQRLKQLKEVSFGFFEAKSYFLTGFGVTVHEKAKAQKITQKINSKLSIPVHFFKKLFSNGR